MIQTMADDSNPVHPGTRIGTILCRAVVPAWILAGASFKLWERNPQLLPKPVTDVTDFVFVRMLGIPRESYLDPAMRFMIGFEIMTALLMIAAPVQAARSLGISLLSLFSAILGVLLLSGAASCGCFGASGPSPGWMLAIDGALLIGLCVFPARGRHYPPAELGRRAGTVMLVPLIVGLGIAYGVPARSAVDLSDHAATTAPPAPPASAGATATPPAPPPPPAPPATNPSNGPKPWPPMPATAKPWYAPEFEKWKGQRLDAQEIMLLLPRPIPVDLNAGRHHVVFMREDCEHCHELLTKYFSGATLSAPTLTIAIPDTTGELLENPCTQCTKTSMPKGITYVFSTPALLTVQDGVVVGVCTDPDDANKVRAALNAK